MRIVVNGVERELADGLSISALVETEGIGRVAYAVEVNRLVVPRREHGERALEDGDVVEIVTLVGGG